MEKGREQKTPGIVGCATCFCANVSDNVMARRLLGLCPLLATTDSVIKAAMMATLLVLVGLLSASLASILRATVYWRFKPIYFAVLGSVATLVVVNAAAVVFPVLIDALGIYALLLAANCQIIAQLQELAEHAPLKQVSRRVLHDGIWILAFMVLIASIREFGAYGGLLHDLSLTANLSINHEPKGWLPVLREPAGALIILSIVLAVLNHLKPSQSSITTMTEREMSRQAEMTESKDG
ncbi:MAG: Rnf-Nqr domain containing protein [Gammaproteobacteria bacterium]